MNKFFRKILPKKMNLILFGLIVLPIIFLWSFKQVIFSGGKNLPTLAIVSDTPIPDFSFINQDRDTITNQDYKGKIYIANFMFTSCPTICKKMTLHMEYLQGKLSKYEDILYLSHTIDQEHDNPEILKEYAERYQNKLGADLSKWNFVTDGKTEIKNIQRSYLSFGEESDQEDTGGFIHSPYFILIDQEGKIRSGFDSYGNPIGVYDGTSLSSVKDLIVDVGVLVSETKRKESDCEK